MSVPRRVPQAEYERRVERTRELMVKAEMDALLITDPWNYRYYSGHSAGVHMGRPQFMLLPVDAEPVLIFYGLALQVAAYTKTRFDSWVKDLRPYVDVPFSMESTVDWGIKAAIEDRKLRKASIGTELGYCSRLGMSHNDFMKLQSDLPGVKFVDGSDIMWHMRMRKSEAELKILRKACEITGKAWTRLYETAKTGMTPQELAQTLAKISIEEGANPTNPGSSLWRGATGPEGRFQKGDILHMDGGATYGEYQADISRDAVFGKPTQKQEKTYENAIAITNKGIEAIRPNVRCCDIFWTFFKEKVVRGVPTLDPVTKREGHGIGSGPGEPPSINAIDTTVLDVGMVITPEPRFLIQDSPFIAMMEETVAVTEDGHEILSKNLPRVELHTIEG